MKTSMIRICSGLCFGILFTIFAFTSQAQNPCDVTETNGGGFTTTIQSVVCNTGYSTHTIILRVEHDGCPGPVCQELSHYSVEAVPGSYSNVSVAVISGGMTYTNIDLGPTLGSDPFDGFKVDGTSGIGDGMAGVFTVTYTLSGGLQAQQTSAKAGQNAQLASFLVVDFESVMNCNGTGCGIIVGPTANDDNATTPQNTPVDIPELSNDVPGTGALDPTTVTFIPGTAPNPATVGTFTVNGTTGLVTFTPVASFTGNTTIDYQICDVNSLCDIATITVVITTTNDSDGDGVPDPDDDYPYDPTRAFDNYFPANGYGTLAYEDLWPGQGDYDFNDLVADYRFKMVTNASNNLVEIFGTFVIKAFGASYHNGFGFQLPNDNISPSHLDVSGYELTAGYITLGSNGLEDGQFKPTVILFDNYFDLMQYPGSGIGVNTSLGSPYVSPYSINVLMEFTGGIYTLAQLDIEHFNPFLIVKQNRGHEIHLPNYPPTDLMNTTLFGQDADDSDPSTGRYYKNSENLPWGINIYESFGYPQEQVDIVNVYYHFVEWATSGGTDYPDWYMDKPNYRNNALIY
ncbi:MAG: LruC domain-containing protein [Bacteroidia bacterium]|nr:LruC domain-containing protein [Bacteroidia bacterium]